MNERATVLIADDHPVVRRGLKVIIQEDERLCVVAEASSGNDALAFILGAAPDVAILDVDMPGMN